MKRRKTIRGAYPMAVCLITAMPIVAAVRHTFFGYVLTAATLLLFIRLSPASHGHENLWMYCLVAVCSVPTNISLILRYIRVGELIWRLMLRPVTYLLLLSVEEIIMGCICRIIWPRQYRLPYYDQRRD